MWNKIYLVALAIAVLMMGVLTYFSYSWLQSVTKPTDVVASFEYYSNFSWTFLFISSVVLLIVANVLLWLSRRAWALWTTLAYFSIFILLQTWWLNGAFLSYQKTNNLTESTFSFLGLGGTALCIIVAIGIFFDQFLVLRMRDRMYGAATAAAEKPTGVMQIVDDVAVIETKPNEET